MRYLYFWNLMVLMFSGSERLATTGFGDLRAATDEEGLLRLFDYLVGGMEGGASTTVA
ncbi:MAG: hypothetical protein HC809_00575 [Gammaproteobacteria bacterium]|nr:hypothetical protein [Gammaproteobacteria bacterium]